MGKELADKYPVARQTFDEADEALGYKLSQLCFEGPEEKLRLTEITQPAILTASVAAWRVLQREGRKPRLCRRTQPGRILRQRRRRHDKFCRCRTHRAQSRQVYAGGRPGRRRRNGRDLGMDLEKVTAVCADAAQGEVCEPANINSAEQIVISGHAAAVERATKIASERGAKRADHAVRSARLSTVR